MAEIRVSGGAAGLSVALDELEVAADRLGRVATEVGEVAIAVGLVGFDPRVQLAALTAPLEYLAVERAVLTCAGPTGAAGLSVDVAATGVATRAAVRAYREGERVVEALADGVATEVGRWVGRSVAPVALGVAVAAAPVAAVVLSTPAGRDAAVAVGLGLGQEVDEILFDHPWLVPAAADGLDGLLIGLGEGVPALGVLLAWRSGRAGVPYPPRNEADALGVVLAATRGIALDESGRSVRVSARPSFAGRPPAGVADLVSNHGPTSGGSRVRVTGIRGPDGSWSWVVDVPGTQTFDPRAGENPWDMTTNALLVAGRRPLVMQAVARALDDARRRAGDTSTTSRVMLTGHSQGGLTAAALAADPTFRSRHRVTHVVTSGAPVASLAVPEEVSVLSLEHDEDLVPGLEGADNPDRRGWVTVERSLADDLGPDGRASQAHDNATYVDTARLVDASDDPSVQAWRDGAAPFVGSPLATTVTADYDVARR
ncbi:hypothetical protein ACQBJO_02670 [Janibacter sp. G349]|uniref:hypothetical protein n=1 Tax=unclassified Janibacter TaxID=2649294 RepID=UPI003B7B4674